MHTIVSYFCGCGGLDLGFSGGFTYHGTKYRPQPFEILGAYDCDPNAIDTYNRYFGKGAAEIRDLSDVNLDGIPAAEILIGGFPCQDFSSCGPQAGLNSDRGNLYQSLVNYMHRFHPKVVVGENVINLMRMNNGHTIETIHDAFENEGYRFEIWNLSAADYGVPQTRRRLFFVGVREDIAGFPEKPTPTTAGAPYSIKWAISDLESVTDESVRNQSQYFKASRAKRGNGQGDETSKADKPAYTIRANPKSRVQFHYSLDRRLTVRECARIQTFPDNFYFPHAKTTSMREIGNAVPPVLAHQVASSVASFLNALEEADADA